ncbi:MAG TPA: O-antigen ligase family protein, partial [Candidatus Eisenbacteria bacterium]|nr:O-antigen ligase family protein [Candidatus Eisenbacteria bacterium]
LEMTLVCSWAAWTALLLYWRSAWTGWVLPPGEMIPGIAVWLAALLMGVVIGLARGNPLRNLGLEFEAALWPLLGIAMMQVFRRRDALVVVAGFFVIGLLHTAFGLTMLQVYQRRLGGVYFTTITGVLLVLLWVLALLTPSRRTRWLCLLGIVPMAAHLLFSFTRGYWLGGIAGFVTATILAWRNLGHFEPESRGRRLWLLPSLLGIGALTLGISVLYFGSGKLLDAVGVRFGSSFSTEASGETMSNIIRLAEYDRAIGDALKSPIVGQGLGYAFVTREPILNTLREQWFVHNYYLLIWLKLGVVGLLAFAFLIGRQVRAAMRMAERDPSWIARALAISATAVTVQMLVILLTNYSLADVTTASVFATMWGLFWVVHRDRTEARGSDASARS